MTASRHISASNFTRRSGGRGAAAFVALALFALLLNSCARSPYTRAITPRADQLHWVDERRAIDKIAYFNCCLPFASKREKAQLGYANLLRQAYARASLDGKDVDAGIRVLNFLRRIHRQSGGTRAAWHAVIEKAKAPRDAPGLKGIPIPGDYR